MSPGQRSSIELWERVLAADGISIEYAPFESEVLAQVLSRRGRTALKAREMLRSYVHRLRLVSHLDEFDAVFVYREAALIGPALLERLIVRGGKPLIYQLDDPLYIPYRSPSNGFLSYLKCFGKVKTICRLSRVVVVNSSHHRDFAKRYARDVRIIPSLVDGDVFRRPSERGERESLPLCIGWSGSKSSAANLAVVADALREVCARTGVRVRLIGATGSELVDMGAIHQPWRATSEVEDLSQLDIGLVPLLDTPWNRRKFYMKVVQYMALGIVPVATPLGSNPEVIEHGRTGFLAESARDWAHYLEILVSNPTLRLDMSREAARAAHTRYTLEANAPVIRAAFRTALPCPGPRSRLGA